MFLSWYWWGVTHKSPQVQEHQKRIKKRHKRNYMGIGARVQSHKSKIKRENRYYTFKHLQNPGTPKGHRSITLHLNVINKCGQKVSNKRDVDYYK